MIIVHYEEINNALTGELEKAMWAEIPMDDTTVELLAEEPFSGVLTDEQDNEIFNRLWEEIAQQAALYGVDQSELFDQGSWLDLVGEDYGY